MFDGNLLAVVGMSIGCICCYAVAKNVKKNSSIRLVWASLVENLAVPYLCHTIAINLPPLLYPEMWKYRYTMYVGITIIVFIIDYIIANILKSVLHKII